MIRLWVLVPQLLKLSLHLICRHTTGGPTAAGREAASFSGGTNWSYFLLKVDQQKWFVASDWRERPGGPWWMHWVLAFFVYFCGPSLQRLSSPGCVARWRGSGPSSAAQRWARIPPTFAALCRGEETARRFEWTTNPGEGRTGWETLMTGRDGRPSSSTRLAGVLVSDVQWRVSSWRTPTVNDFTLPSVLQVTLEASTAVSVSSAGLDRAATRGKLPFYGRTSTPWPPRSCRSSWMLWSSLRPPPIQTMWSPPSTGWDSWDQTGPSLSLPTSPSTTSLSGNITTPSETLCLVKKHFNRYNWLVHETDYKNVI